MLTYRGSLWLVAWSVYMCYKHYIKCFRWFRHWNSTWHGFGFTMQGKDSIPNSNGFLIFKKKKKIEINHQYTWLPEYQLRSQSHTWTTFPLKLSRGTSEASFVNTLSCMKRVMLWHTAQGWCDHSVPQYWLINKNSLILFSVHLKQFDMKANKKKE